MWSPPPERRSSRIFARRNFRSTRAFAAIVTEQVDAAVDLALVDQRLAAPISLLMITAWPRMEKMSEHVSNVKNTNRLSLCSCNRWKIGLAGPLTYSYWALRPDKPDKFNRGVAKSSSDPMP